jgi:hypothetical protein
VSQLVIIAVPLYGNGNEQFWSCLEKMRYHTARKGIDTLRKTKKGCYIDHNRNLLVRDVRGIELNRPSHILWLDADMTFAPDLLMRLLSADKDIVVANYYRKQAPHTPVVSAFKGEGELYTLHVRPERGELRPLDSAGTGVCLTRLAVFETVPFPWFKTEYVLPPENLKGEKDLIEGHVLIGDDTYFFLKAGAFGYTVYCDFSIEIGHVGDKVYDWRDYERNQGDNTRPDPEACGHGDQYHDQ